MKIFRILAGVTVIGLAAAPLSAVPDVGQQEGQTADLMSGAQKEVRPIPAPTQPGASPQRADELPHSKLGTAPPTLLYKPPLGLGSPTGLIAGGSRGTNACLSGDAGDRQATLTLSVLAPADHVGLTVHEQPSLYWYLSAETTCRVELTLTDDQAIKPLLELVLSPPVRAGVQRVRLADHNLRLAPGVQYQWAVALVPDAEHRSKDVVAVGEIKRVPVTEGLQIKLGQADKTEVAAVYAEAGLWYDAITTISDLMANGSRNLAPRMQRAALLEQIRLPEVADYDRRLSADQGS